MLFKVIAVVIATVLIYGYLPIHALWTLFAVIGPRVVVRGRGRGVVPQQSAWVVERLRQFHQTSSRG